MKAPFRLVTHQEVSRDTVECLRALLNSAEKGEVVGVAIAAMHKRRHYTVHSCGEVHRNPTFARGMVAALSDDLGRQVWGQD